MFILSKSQSNLVNMNEVENIFIGADKKSIKANMVSRSGCELAKYQTSEQCKFALGMLYSSIQANENVFSFPKEIDINFAKQHGGDYKTKKNSHGGS